MTKPQDLLALAQAAIHYTQAVAHTQHCKELLRGGYIAWRDATGHQHRSTTCDFSLCLVPLDSCITDRGAELGLLGFAEFTRDGNVTHLVLEPGRQLHRFHDRRTDGKCRTGYADGTNHRLLPQLCPGLCEVLLYHIDIYD